MERLTRRMCGGWGVVEGCELNTLHGMRMVVGRLASYENTGLTPEEVAELAKIVRCKDCEYKKKASYNEKGFLICPASGMEITDNDFCSYGEKKGE